MSRLRCPVAQRLRCPVPQSCHQTCLVFLRRPGRPLLLVLHRQPGPSLPLVPRHLLFLCCSSPMFLCGSNIICNSTCLPLDCSFQCLSPLCCCSPWFHQLPGLQPHPLRGSAFADGVQPSPRRGSAFADGLQPSPQRGFRLRWRPPTWPPEEFRLCRQPPAQPPEGFRLCWRPPTLLESKPALPQAIHQSSPVALKTVSVCFV